MSSKSGKSVSIEEMSRATWDMCADVEVSQEVTTAFQLRRAKRKGIWEMKLVAWWVVDGMPVRKCCEVTREWPNSQTAHLTAQMFQMAHTLDVMVAEAVRDRDTAIEAARIK